MSKRSRAALRHWTRAMPGLAAMVVAAQPAGANDSSAELATGGLRLLQSGAVEMRSEDLAISLQRIAVDYRFYNATAQDVTSIVAFPLPDIAVTGDDQISLPTDDPNDPFAFHTAVNGKPVSMRLEQKAMAGGIDQAAVLTALHIPLAPYAQATSRALNHLPPATRDRLGSLKLIVPDDDGDGPHQVKPGWTLKSTYYWTQVFPSRQEIRVSHSYQPSVGESAQTALGSSGWRRSAGMERYAGDYCPDQTLLSTIAAVMKEKKSAYPTYAEQRIDYVLHTGANWSQPIGHFHLTLDKGAPVNLISVCLSDLRKTGPTRFELDRTDFRPATDLKILILEPIG